MSGLAAVDTSQQSRSSVPSSFFRKWPRASAASILAIRVSMVAVWAGCGRVAMAMGTEAVLRKRFDIGRFDANLAGLQDLREWYRYWDPYVHIDGRNFVQGAYVCWVSMGCQGLLVAGVTQRNFEVWMLPRLLASQRLPWHLCKLLPSELELHSENKGCKKRFQDTATQDLH